jgi:hypothetical protein
VIPKLCSAGPSLQRQTAARHQGLLERGILIPIIFNLHTTCRRVTTSRPVAYLPCNTVLRTPRGRYEQWKRKIFSSHRERNHDASHVQSVACRLYLPSYRGSFIEVAVWKYIVNCKQVNIYRTSEVSHRHIFVTMHITSYTELIPAYVCDNLRTKIHTSSSNGFFLQFH